MKSKSALWLYRVFRFLVGIVFVWSGISKLLSPEGFAEIISAYAILPDNLVYPASITIPAVELVSGTALILDTRFSLEAVTLMLLLFIAVLWYGIAEGIDVECGCFSMRETAGENSQRNAMFRDLLFIVMVIYLYAWKRHKRINTVPAD